MEAWDGGTEACDFEADGAFTRVSSGGSGQREAWADAGLLLRNRNVGDRTGDMTREGLWDEASCLPLQSAYPERPLSLAENKTNPWKQDVLFPMRRKAQNCLL